MPEYYYAEDSGQLSLMFGIIPNPSLPDENTVKSRREQKNRRDIFCLSNADEDIFQMSMFSAQCGAIPLACTGINKGEAAKFEEYIISDILREACGNTKSKLDVYNHFRKGKSIEEISVLLLKSFRANTVRQGRGRGYYISGRQYATWADMHGIRISLGTSARYEEDAIQLSWIDVAERIQVLLNEGRYLTKAESLNADARIYEETAFSIRAMIHEMRDDAYQKYLVKTRFLPGSGFSAGILKGLKEEETFNLIVDELTVFVNANSEKKLLRSRLYTPEEVLNNTKELKLLNTKEFPLCEEIDTSFTGHFISQDEIYCEITRNGSHVRNSVMRICSFFGELHSLKEKESFLRKEYGVGGSSGADILGEYHDAKGLTFSERDCEDIFYSYGQLAKHIDQLIEKGEMKYAVKECS